MSLLTHVDVWPISLLTRVDVRLFFEFFMLLFEYHLANLYWFLNGDSGNW